jgi:hypothetical protein
MVVFVLIYGLNSKQYIPRAHPDTPGYGGHLRPLLFNTRVFLRRNG